MDKQQRVLVINPTRSIGKTTIATNLAVASAYSGDRVALLMRAGKQPSRAWSQHRPIALPNVETFQYQELDQIAALDEAIHNFETLILDVGAHTNSSIIDQWLAISDTILIPIAANTINSDKAMRSITNLLTHRLIRYSNRKIAIILNHTHQIGQVDGQLKHFLHCLDIDYSITIPYMASYRKGLNTGKSVFEVEQNEQTKTEMEKWQSLVRWIRKPSPQKIRAREKNILPHKPLSVPKKKNRGRMHAAG